MIDDNTIVIYSADNGQARPPHGIGSAYPLKGFKGVTWEGGLRVPTIIRWPSKIAAAQDNKEIMTAMDLLPTFAKLARAKMPTDRVIDGKDITNCLTKGEKSPHEAFFYHRISNLDAVRAGDWKLHFFPKNKIALYNLKDDIAETKNVANVHPDIVQKLKQYADTFNKDIAKNSRKAAFVENPISLRMKNNFD